MDPSVAKSRLVSVHLLALVKSGWLGCKGQSTELGHKKSFCILLLTRSGTMASGGYVSEDPIYRNFNFFPYTGAKLWLKLSISFAGCKFARSAKLSSRQCHFMSRVE